MDRVPGRSLPPTGGHGITPIWGPGWRSFKGCCAAGDRRRRQPERDRAGRAAERVHRLLRLRRHHRPRVHDGGDPARAALRLRGARAASHRGQRTAGKPTLAGARQALRVSSRGILAALFEDRRSLVRPRALGRGARRAMSPAGRERSRREERLADGRAATTRISRRPMSCDSGCRPLCSHGRNAWRSARAISSRARSRTSHPVPS